MKKLLLLSTIILTCLACKDSSTNTQPEADADSLEVIDETTDDSVVFRDESKIKADIRPDQNYLKMTDKEVRKQVWDDLRQRWKENNLNPEVTLIEIYNIKRYDTKVMCMIRVTLADESITKIRATRTKNSPFNKFQFGG